MKIKRFWPSLIQAQTWKEMGLETWHQLRSANLLLEASGLAYTTIISIVPVLAVSFAIFQAFGGLDRLYDIIRPFVLENLAQSSGQGVMKAIEGSIEKIHAGTLGISGMIALLFTCMAMLATIEKAINRVWKVTLRRRLFHRIAAYWFFITLGPLSFAIAFGVISSSTMTFTRFLPAGTAGFVLSIAFFFGVYKWIPNRHVSALPALIPALLTTLLWALARISYSIYIQEVVSYHKIYGSLGAIPILLLWIYITWVIILAGAALSAALQKRFDRFD